MAHGREMSESVGMVETELLNLEGADKAVARLGIGVVVELDQSGETLCQFLVAEGFEGLAIVGVDWSVRELVATDNRLDIHAGAATEDGPIATGDDRIESGYEIVLEMVEIVFLASIADVDKMARDAARGEIVLVEILARA